MVLLLLKASRMLLIRSGSIIELVNMPLPMADLCHALPDITRNSFFFFQLQNISEHVASCIKDPSRMVGQMQMWKLAVAVFGTVRH